jgi:hypothetical protein
LLKLRYDIFSSDFVNLKEFATVEEEAG